VTDGTLSLPADLVAWLEEVGGGTATSIVRKPGGARKEAWFVDLTQGDGTVRELFVHYDRASAGSAKDPWTLHREASVYLALADTEVPVPRVIGVHPTRQAMVSERLIGENWFSHLTDATERESTAADFMARLAALHSLDPAELDLPGFGAPTTISAAVGAELDSFAALLASRGGDIDPALDITLDWLKHNAPHDHSPAVLVQGDTGPGNFMFADGRVVAIVDWELAHLGDPMEDIAWLSLRATQEPFTDFPTRLGEYERLSGRPIDEQRVRYYQVLAEAKLQVMSHSPSAGSTDGAPSGYGGGDVGNAFIYGVLHRRLWLEALAGAFDLSLPPAEVPPESEPHADRWMYQAVLDQLRDVVVPHIDDPLAKARAKGLARMIKYLAQVDSLGPFFDECELIDLAQLLDRRPGSIRAGRRELAAAVRAQRVGEREYLGYRWRRVARESELARPAMGALADRHWPSLR